MKVDFKFNAIILMWTLVAGLVGLVGVGATGFYYGSGYLKSLSKEADHAKIDAEVSADEISRLKKLQSFMSNNKFIIDRVNSVTTDTTDFQYQNKIVNDLKVLSTKAGINIIGYNFEQTETTATTSASTPKDAKSSGLKTVRLSITLATPLQYDSLVRFMKASEQNLTRLQITDITLAPDANNPTLLQNPTIAIQG